MARVVELFQLEAREPKVIDRRAHPVHGYSAVHVIVFPEGVPVEIQIRTTWQHEWAEVFEKLADAVGRGIRYGAAPVLPRREPLPNEPDEPSRHRRWRAWKEADDELATAMLELRVLVVEMALVVSEVIADAEEAVVNLAADADVEAARSEAEDGLRRLKKQVEALESDESS